MGVSVRSIRTVVSPLLSLALQRFKISHMYTTMGLLGIFLAARGGYLPVFYVLPVISITITTTGVYILNDVFDIEIDRIVHPDRALARGATSVRHATIAAVSLMVLGTVLAYLRSFTSGCLVAAIMLFGILYSAPPVRLRRFPVVPNGIIGLFVFLSFLAGATFWHSPITGKLCFGALLLWGMFLCASTAKDLENAEADKVDGVKSLPVLLGFDRGFKVTAFIVSTLFAFPVLFILLFGLRLAFVALIVALFLLWIYFLRKMYQNRQTSEMHMWWERGFAPFLGVQVSLLVAALL